MRRTTLFLAAVVVALVAPTASLAKNIAELKLCGPSSCASITDKDVLQRWEQAGDGAATWVVQSARAVDIFANAVRGVEPFPAPTITGGTLGRRTVSDPASYARLFEPRWEIAADWSATDWRRIRLTSLSPSPWTDGKNTLLYASRKRTLSRDGTVVVVPKSVARRLARARSLEGGGGRAQTGFAAAGIGAVGLAAIALLRRRR